MQQSVLGITSRQDVSLLLGWAATNDH